MEDLLSKEHYSYKIYALKMESSAYPPSPLLQTTPFYKQSPIFTGKSLSSLLGFFKNSNLPINKGGEGWGGVHILIIFQVHQIFIEQFLSYVKVYIFWKGVLLTYLVWFLFYLKIDKLQKIGKTLKFKNKMLMFY